MATAVAYPVTAPPTAWADDDGRADRAVLDLAAELDEIRQENEALTMRLAKVHQLLRVIKRIVPKPAKMEGADEDPSAALYFGCKEALDAVKTRVEYYLASVPEVRS